MRFQAGIERRHPMAQAGLGYDDTPILPRTKWRVHDGERPQPRVVTPGIPSTQEKSGEPPSDAVALFDGTDLGGWQTTKDGAEAGWRVESGFMEVVPGTGNIQTKQHFGDCQLHVEFREPDVMKGESQGRGNSGVFLMGLYEIQVLDCYENLTYPDGNTASVYGEFPPLVNACRKPGEWQTYDILWEAPRFEGKRLIRPAYVTVFHNGIVVHNHTELIGPTTHRQILPYVSHPTTGPLMLQDHGHLVRFRNIWYRELKQYDEA
ncbi:MAG: hypothetical protein AUJ92_11695 [Armatimonadetes bacterium CG2_30_59_28]|nr:MAG: hypothetical protein AUJ92_11695 [Armatimonadetes bacterium CG2_30_59_28]